MFREAAHTTAHVYFNFHFPDETVSAGISIVMRKMHRVVWLVPVIVDNVSMCRSIFRCICIMFGLYRVPCCVYLYKIALQIVAGEHDHEN